MSIQGGDQHVILCEGYDDRSFWAGWLTGPFECSDPTAKGRVKVDDAWGRPVLGGRFLFETPIGAKILLQPFGGRSQAAGTVSEYVSRQVYHPDRLVLSLDSDATEETAGNVPGRALFEQIKRDLKLAEPALQLVLWECHDPHPTPGVPEKQTLERLVSAAIHAAYAGRGEAVDRWLADEPLGATTGPKSYGFSYLAKWYADHGADDFWRAVWRDPDVARELRSRLEASGAWAVAEALVRA